MHVFGGELTGCRSSNIGHGLRQDYGGLAGEHPSRRPNATTRRALGDAQARRRLTSFASPDEPFEDLGL